MRDRFHSTRSLVGTGGCAVGFCVGWCAFRLQMGLAGGVTADMGDARRIVSLFALACGIIPSRRILIK